jgi:hypothetical protein
MAQHLLFIYLLWSLWDLLLESLDSRELPEYGFWMCFNLILSGSFLSNKRAGYVKIIWEKTQRRWRLPFIINKDTLFPYLFISNGHSTDLHSLPSFPIFVLPLLLSYQLRIIFKLHRKLCVLMGPYCIPIHGYVFESNKAHSFLTTFYIHSMVRLSTTFPPRSLKCVLRNCNFPYPAVYGALQILLLVSDYICEHPFLSCLPDMLSGLWYSPHYCKPHWITFSESTPGWNWTIMLQL